MKQIITTILLSLLCGFATLIFAQDEQDTLRQITIEDPSQYLPDYLDNVYIGMPLADFENIKDTLKLDISNNVSDMWFGAIEDVNEEGIDEIIYKFDKEEDGVNIERPLYEIIIKFLETDYEDEYINQKFRHHQKTDDINDRNDSNDRNITGDTNNTNYLNDKEWIFKTDKDYMLIVKEVDDTVQIIATMAGTEWDPGR